MTEAIALATRIIEDAGGELVGRTRFQKIAFLLKLAGFEDHFQFEYYHYGPFSEELADAIEIAAALGAIREVEKVADWGGRYSVYTLNEPKAPTDERRAAFVQAAKKVNAVELELAATAAYLYEHERIGAEKSGNPWNETARRKPTKAADGRLERAIEVYDELRRLPTASPLPDLPRPNVVANEL